MASVQAAGVSKRFLLQQDRADSVGQLLVRMLPRRKREPPKPFWALKDVSFDMRDGRSLGIIGHNGAGKSTLLKILTRTMAPTTGTVRVNGRTSALIELGAGFHPDFTGRENIVLNASILGITRREIETRMQDIIEFSGISAFIDTPVKYYSSGMHARLGFSVAIHVDPEILIVDEVLAVGDQAFAEQCMTRIFEMKRRGVGILLVTHGLDAVELLMDDALWLDHGQVAAFGSPHEVIEAYRSHVSRSNDDAAQTATEVPAAAESTVLVERCTVRGEDGGSSIQSGSAATIGLSLVNLAGEPKPVHLRLLLTRPDGLAVAELSTRFAPGPLTLPGGRHTVSLHIPHLFLTAGTFLVSVLVGDQDGKTLVEDHRAAELAVSSRASQVGVCCLPASWSILE